MIDALARALVRPKFAWAVIAIVMLLAAVAVVGASEVGQDDDILAFLPEGNADVALFRDLNERFGGLDVAIVGIELPPVEGSQGVFGARFLERLRDTTRAINRLKSVSMALSLTNVEDFTANEEQGGIVLRSLVSHIPANEKESQEMRAHILSRDHVVGNLISKDGTALNIYCFTSPGADQKVVAQAIQAAAIDGLTKDAPAGHIPTLYWGGAPFISTYIFETTQQDMSRLTPYAVLAILIIMIFAFRDLAGTALALVATGLGIVASHGLMGLTGQSFNIVLSAMPIILFAVGSAYSIHILSTYYRLQPLWGREEAIRRTVSGVGPTVLAAGLTTVAGLMSFLTMDIAPMRTFGLFTAVGIFVSLILSLTFVPAVIRVAKIGRRAEASGAFSSVIASISAGAQRNRLWVGLGLAAVSAFGLYFAGTVDTRMDNAAFFAAGSPPDKAERFLGTYFGGSQFVQIHVAGDLREPEVLRTLTYLSDDLITDPLVSDVLQIGMALSEANFAMEGARRIPNTRERVGLLFEFMRGNQSVSQLVDDERKEALLTAKVLANRPDDIEAVLNAIEARAPQLIPTDYVLAAIDGPRGPAAKALSGLRITARIAELSRRRGVPIDAAFLTRVEAEVAFLLNGARVAPSEADVTLALAKHLRSDESVAELPADDPGLADRIAKAVVALGPAPDEDRLLAALATVTGKPADSEFVDDIVFALEAPLSEQWDRAKAMAKAVFLMKNAEFPAPTPGQEKRLLANIGFALLDLDLKHILLPAAAGETPVGTLAVQITGLPVLHRGLSRSVTENQWKSLSVALGLVLLIMTILFRSLWSGLMATAPTVFTLIVIYGGMGIMGVRLDIGTSMLASIIIGAGVDYAVHLVAAWRAHEGGDLASGAHHAGLETGSAIWTNAIMVGAGFFVLTLGEAKPLQNVGGLTAAAMMTAAVATFLIVPVLARKTFYLTAGVHSERPSATSHQDPSPQESP